MSLPDYISKKIITTEAFSKLYPERNAKRPVVVFTNGCFDLLHAGHIHLLAEAAGQGDLLVVGLNSDDSVRRLKGENRPVNNESARATLLAALTMVDYVILFGEDTPLDLIYKVSPDILVKGGDYKTTEIVGYDFVTSGGGRVVTIPLLEGHSSSRLIGKFRNGQPGS